MNSYKDDNQSSHLLSTYCIPSTCFRNDLLIIKILAVGIAYPILQRNWIIYRFLFYRETKAGVVGGTGRVLGFTHFMKCKYHQLVLALMSSFKQSN